MGRELTRHIELVHTFNHSVQSCTKDGWKKLPMELQLEYARPERLSKNKTRLAQHNCIHDLRYEKWIHNGPKQGMTYHYKEACKKCGYGRHVPRTKAVFEAVKNQPWHTKKKKLTHPRMENK